MPLPASVTTVPVHVKIGKKVGDEWIPAKGHVAFTGPYALRDTTGKEIVGPPYETATLDANGEDTVDLIDPNDPDLSPSGWAYTVSIATDVLRDTYQIEIPANTPQGTTLEFSDLAPAVTPPSVVTYALDSAAVHRTGAETVAGVKTFSSLPTIPQTPSAATDAASKGYVDTTTAAAQAAAIAGAPVQSVAGRTGAVVLGAADLPALVPLSRRPAWRPASWSQQFQSGHGWSATNVASSNLNDTSMFVRGTQCATITTLGNGTKGNFRGVSLPSTPLDMTGKMLRVVMRVDDVTHLNRIEFYLGSGGLANYFLWTVHTHSATALPNYISSGEWVTFHVQWADVIGSGGTYTLTNGVPSTRSGLTDMQVSAWDDAGGQLTAHIQEVEVIADTTATFPNGVVSVTFDDGYASQYSLARPKMDALGYRGTAYLIADAIGGGGTMTLTQAQQLQAYSGWEIAGHAYSSANHNAGLHTLTSAQVNQDFRSLKSWLISNGFSSDNFAYPLGHFDQTTDGVWVDQIAAQYWATSRSIIAEGAVGSFPPAMPQRVRAKTGISSAGTSVATITATGGPLDRCKASGSWYIICLHDVVAGSATTSTQISQADFNTLMDAINSRGIPVLPVGDVMRYYT